MKIFRSTGLLLAFVLCLCAFCLVTVQADTAAPIGPHADAMSKYVDADAFADYICDELDKFNTQIDLTQYNIPYSQENNATLFSFLDENTEEYFCVKNFSLSRTGNIYYAIMVQYNCSAEEYANQKAQVDAVANEMLTGLKGNTTLSDAEKALVLHDRLAVHVEYDFTYQRRDIYQALVSRISVCEGYTKAYNYLLGKLGISGYTCTSDYHGHMWNIVRIDGKDYHVDVTWDDATPDIVGRVNHVNFLRSSAGIAEEGHGIPYRDGHTDIGNVDFNTAPSSTKYDNYYWQKSHAEFQLINGKLYYIDSEAQTLNTVNGTKQQVLCKVEDSWAAGATSHWRGNYARLSNDGTNLLYSLSDSVYRFDLQTKTSTKIYTPQKALDYSSIYGMTLEGNKLICQLRLTPNEDPTSRTVSTDYASPVHIVTQPTSKSVVAGKTAAFTVKASGSGLKYQWQYRTSAKGSWKNASATGNKTATIKIPGTPERNGYQYRCLIKDSQGNSVYSKAVTLSVTAPKITAQPANKYLPVGKTAVFSVSVNGTGLKYQWQYRTSAKGSWKATSATGNKTATLKVPVTAARNSYQYRCKITDKYGNTVYSNAATLKVVTLKITTQPASVTLAKGKTATFKVVAKGTNLKYQWQYRTSTKGNWKKTSATGSKTATLKIPVTVARNGYQYRCVITDPYGNVINSKAATLNVK